MLDIKFVRENPEIVKQNIRNKFQDRKLPLVDEVIALDLENRQAKGEADELLRRLRPAMETLPRGQQLAGAIVVNEPLPRTATGKIKRWELQQKMER